MHGVNVQRGPDSLVSGRDDFLFSFFLANLARLHYFFQGAPDDFFWDEFIASLLFFPECVLSVGLLWRSDTQDDILLRYVFT